MLQQISKYNKRENYGGNYLIAFQKLEIDLNKGNYPKPITHNFMYISCLYIHDILTYRKLNVDHTSIFCFTAIRCLRKCLPSAIIKTYVTYGFVCIHDDGFLRNSDYVLFLTKFSPENEVVNNVIPCRGKLTLNGFRFRYVV